MPEDVATISRARAEILRRVEEGIEAGPFRADWESLELLATARPLGIAGCRVRDLHPPGAPLRTGFAKREWHPRQMYRQGTTGLRASPGDLRDAGTGSATKDFIPDFTGSAFDPQDWASLFRRAGAQFVVPVRGAPRDGFCT